MVEVAVSTVEHTLTTNPTPEGGTETVETHTVETPVVDTPADENDGEGIDESWLTEKFSSLENSLRVLTNLQNSNQETFNNLLVTIQTQNSTIADLAQQVASLKVAQIVSTPAVLETEQPAPTEPEAPAGNVADPPEAETEAPAPARRKIRMV